jgi:hypothetical protein
VVPFMAKFVANPTPGTYERLKNGMLDVELKMPAHERALRWRDEYCRMLGEHYRAEYKPAVIDSGLMRVPLNASRSMHAMEEGEARAACGNAVAGRGYFGVPVPAQVKYSSHEMTSGNFKSVLCIMSNHTNK